jgi:hypothetical protein
MTYAHALWLYALLLFGIMAGFGIGLKCAERA